MFPEIAGLHFTFMISKIMEQLFGGGGGGIIGNVGVMELGFTDSPDLQSQVLYRFDMSSGL